jgi:hypothetical protein
MDNIDKDIQNIKKKLNFILDYDVNDVNKIIFDKIPRYNDDLDNQD